MVPTYDADAPAARYGHVVGIALQYLGIPYVWGGSSPSTGFDCSGFTSYVYAQVGVYLPHHAASQYNMGTPVAYEQLAPGDLVFFSGLGHVGLYIGGGQFVHAPHTGDVVRISSLVRARRLVRRRPPALSGALLSPRCSSGPSVRLGVQGVDVRCEVLLHRATPNLERRRDLARLHREVPREDREALHLLEP